MTAPGGLLWPDLAVRRSRTVSQCVAMTSRAVHSARVENEFLVAIVMPIVFALGLYLPLRSVMDRQGIDFVQFLVPIIVLQSSAFTAVSAAQRSAMDAMRGMNHRLSAMPVDKYVPLVARMVTNTVRSVVSLAAALICGALLGFRFSGSVWGAAGFVVTALFIGLVFSLGADALGLYARNPEATSQLLVLPQLVLGLLSTGFAPETSFPEWARPFARNQPISHFSATLRGLADGTVDMRSLVPSMLWLAGAIALFVPLAVRAQRVRA